MSRRKGRPLAPEEEELWRAVKKTVTPLRPEKATPPPALVAAEPDPERSLIRTPPAAAAASPQKPALPKLHPFGKRERQAVNRGRTTIDGRLDLHGFRQDEAHARLSGFLHYAQAAGWKVVLVITGKGRPGGDFQSLHDHERGVLRRVVPMWLSLPDFRSVVLGYEDAGPVHGGGGALYIRIRKRK
jgi:DNA-nicking Smr family endonuclease